jgi:g-D-glutamyl-meso-diaminopimelate peptidase
MITLSLASYEKIDISTTAIKSKSSSESLLVPQNGVRRILLMGTLHGREWISPASLINLARMIAIAVSKGDEQMTDLLKTTEINIIPMVNPDGYEFTRTPISKNELARQWRKNRRLLPCKGEKCVHGR